ncbi:MAG: elongation factor P [Flammeovirgaceae bacterium]|nr:elongation factor P [Flammeovirgaceae bacterium]MDW8287503.1 elongation factor P [Flammeovirgaceae bacterium]
MATTTADFKNGMCIEFNNDLYVIVEFQHVKPGKGPAFVRTKLKSITSGKVIDHTWASGERVNDVRIERRPHQFLYKDDLGYHFMNSETFEEVIVDEKKIVNPDLMKDGQEVEISFHAEKEQPLLCELPAHVILKVTYTEPGVKGDTATAAFKPATLETGAVVQVPLFVQQDDLLKIDTRTRSYVERAK